MAYLIDITGPVSESIEKNQVSVVIKNGIIESNARGIHVSDANLTLENVKMNCVERCVGAYNNANVTIDKDCVLTTYNEACTAEGDPDITVMVYSDNGRKTAHTKVDIFGSVINNNAFQGGWAISGNGNKDHGDNEIIIEKNASVVAMSDSAIYHPQAGTITVNGSVAGPDGIYMKSGKIVVGETANIKGNGSADTTYEYSGDGTKTPLGHGIVCEFTNYPGGLTKLEVNGGAISSSNKEAIGYYVSPKCALQDLEALKTDNISISSSAVLSNKVG